MFMKIVCEGCGTKISKNDQIRHDTVECNNPYSKCKFCKTVVHLGDLISHQQSCDMRSIVKVEYNDPDHGTGLLLQNQEQDEQIMQQFNQQIGRENNKPKRNAITSGTSVANYNKHREKPAGQKTVGKLIVNSQQNPLYGDQNLNTELVKRDSQQYLDIAESSMEHQEGSSL